MSSAVLWQRPATPSPADDPGSVENAFPELSLTASATPFRRPVLLVGEWHDTTGVEVSRGSFLAEWKLDLGVGAGLVAAELSFAFDL